MTKLFSLLSWTMESLQCFYIRHFGPSLRHLFEEHHGNLIFKWDHYINPYETHLSQFRGKRITLVEIGVFQGGSLQLWRKYFGPRAMIYGIDVDQRCTRFSAKNVQIVLGDQGDPEFWSRFKKAVPRIDVLIDDGGHHVHQQVTTFEQMFEVLSPSGVYVCEDLHTNYWPDHGGGPKGKADTFISLSKNLIDAMNFFQRFDADETDKKLGRQIRSICCYESMVFVQKGKIESPVARSVGVPVFVDSTQMMGIDNTRKRHEENLQS